MCRALMRLKWKKWSAPAAEPVLVQIAGKQWWLHNEASSQDLLREIWIMQCYRPRIGLPQQGRLLDLGANTGMAAAWFAQQYPGWQLTCVEPDPANAGLLQRNLSGNGLAARLLQAAVATESGTKWIAASAAGALNKTFDQPGTDQAVQTLNINDLLQQPWSLVKMDIEGAEWPILEHMIHTGSFTASPYWVMELHQPEQHSHTLQALRQAFAAKGYTIETASGLWHFYLPEKPH
ncbi:MAG: FkbM family methyltransferase [Chitinophagaceae bacterium]|nr:FkbM family methyltransferase [Chitinophagaceae bacterium]